MSLDPNTEEEENLVTPQLRRSPRIGWKERIERGEDEEAKESSDEFTEAYLSAAEEEEEEAHSETIEEHVAGLDRILEYPGVDKEIEIEEELAEEDSISSEESDSEFSCGETSSDSGIGSEDSWSTYSYRELYTESDTDSYSELDSDSEESDGSSMKASRRLYFGGEKGEFENFIVKWKNRGAKKGYSPYIMDTRHEDLPEAGLMEDWTGVAKDVKRRQKKALRLHNYCIADLQEACEPRMVTAWIEESVGTTDEERRAYPFGRVWVVLKQMISHYRGSSMLDITEFDVEAEQKP